MLLSRMMPYGSKVTSHMLGYDLVHHFHMLVSKEVQHDARV